MTAIYHYFKAAHTGNGEIVSFYYGIPSHFINRLLLTLFATVFAPSSPSYAGPLDEAKAKLHLAAVAAGDVDALMRDYNNDSSIEWVGGPLDGRYRGRAAIRELWRKFAAANQGKPRTATSGEFEIHSNPKGASIETTVEYGGIVPVRVWHVLTYRDGSLAAELWQILAAKPNTP